jgi:hypothetical protein
VLAIVRTGLGSVLSAGTDTGGDGTFTCEVKVLIGWAARHELTAYNSLKPQSTYVTNSSVLALAPMRFIGLKE